MSTPLFPPRTDPRLTTVPSIPTQNNLIRKGYNIHRGTKYFRRPLLSPEQENVVQAVRSEVRVVAHIMTDAQWWSKGSLGWTGGLGVVWGKGRTQAAQNNVAERSPLTFNDTENPTLWIAMIRALETAPNGVDIEIRLTRPSREAREHQTEECPYHVRIRYQDLIKYLLYLEQTRTGNVFYIYVYGEELDEEEVEGENNRGFEAATALALYGTQKPDPPIRNWSSLVPESIKAKPRFTSRQDQLYKDQYDHECQNERQVPWAFSRSDATTHFERDASARPRFLFVEVPTELATDSATESGPSSEPGDPASSDSDDSSSADELANTFASVNL